MLKTVFAAAIVAVVCFCTPALAAGNPINALASWAGEDVTAALAASTAYPDLQDSVGNACLVQMQTLASIVKAHPLPVTLHLASDLEYARLVQGELNIVCRNPSCSQVWADADNAAAALQVVKLQVSLPTLCKNVPVVGLALPAVAAPAATPAVAK